MGPQVSTLGVKMDMTLKGVIFYTHNGVNLTPLGGQLRTHFLTLVLVSK